MDELVKALTSPAWWMSVVVAGIAINLVAAYVKPLLDLRLSSLSDWWRSRSKRQETGRRAFIARLSSDEHEQVMAALLDLRHRHRATYLLVFGAFMMLVTQVMPMHTWEAAVAMTLGIAGASFFGSYRSFLRAAATNRALLEARAVARKSREGDSNGEQLTSGST